MITFQPTEHMDEYLLPQNIWEDVITSTSPDPMLDLVVKGFPYVMNMQWDVFNRKKTNNCIRPYMSNNVELICRLLIL